MAYYGKCADCGKEFNDKSAAEAHGRGFTTTALQIRLAWEALFKRPLPGDLPYVNAASQIRREMGCNEGAAYVQGF